ncbi:hypothetical protein llap_6366 [Limosa lapponica baueri]|uniref:Uncharacterized protein n=1 Tax=Limosa lapponica baueri TaxID=1758121 RepID=A0A2I0UB78_LIMLA|nr:hypothetical protein llap_6366 [Limosa lapponica baueri]
MEAASVGTEFGNRAGHSTDRQVEGMNFSSVCLKDFPKQQHMKIQTPEVAYKSLRKHKPPETEESSPYTPMPHTEPDASQITARAGFANAFQLLLGKAEERTSE